MNMTTVPSNQLKAMQYEIADLKEQLAECQRERDVLLIAHKAHETANLKLLAKMKQQAFELAALKAEQVEPVEPVAYLDANYGFMRCGNAADHLPIGTKLYASSPPQPAPSVPKGYVLVPVEPTGEMNGAGYKAFSISDNPSDCYKAMLSAKE